MTHGDGIGLPWTLMNKLEGQRLSDLFRNPRPQDEAAAARQVAQVYLALFHVRFPSIGSLFIQEATGEFYIGAPASMAPDDASACITADGAPWTSALEYHTQWCTDQLRDLMDKRFGTNRWFEYVTIWHVRSMVSAFQCVAEEQQGFPLALPDLHFTNFLATADGDGCPRITGIIDFDAATTVTWADFALPPDYAADPCQGDQEEMQYSRQQRAIFFEMLEQLEGSQNPDLPLSKMMHNWRIRWLMRKMADMPSEAERLEYYNYIYGTDEDRSKDMWDYTSVDVKVQGPATVESTVSV
jgi:hypothetical protein